MAHSEDEKLLTLPEHLGTDRGLPDKERYKDVSKSTFLRNAEKMALKQNAPAMIVTVAAKPINQDVKLRTGKKEEDLVSTFLY